MLPIKPIKEPLDKDWEAHPTASCSLFYAAEVESLLTMKQGNRAELL
jgi:hypothetical protein